MTKKSKSLRDQFKARDQFKGEVKYREIGDDIFVLADGTRLVCSGHAILQLPPSPSGRLATIAGVEGEKGFKDGAGHRRALLLRWGL